MTKNVKRERRSSVQNPHEETIKHFYSNKNLENCELQKKKKKNSTTIKTYTEVNLLYYYYFEKLVKI